MRYRRAHAEGACYFFTLVTQRRQPLLTLPVNVARLREAFRREREVRPFVVDAIVVMPDHLHCLWTLPEGDADYSGRWSRIKRYVSAGAVGVPEHARTSSRIAKRESGFWQRRFWEHTIRDEADWRNHMDYIHFNPVKHGLVQSASDWPHSSFARCVARGLYDRGWGDVEPAVISTMNFE
ncbi:MAG TPA: transposase [Solimonas sp.]|nr:transposase [Solimonas sp.]